MKKKWNNFWKDNWGIVVLFAIFFVLNIGALCLYTTSMMLNGASHSIYSQMEQLPHSRVALIFGGGMESETEMSIMQQDRVQAGIDLYHAGIVDMLMMTGDDGNNRFDEVTAMRTFAVEQGVDQEDILVDFHGYRTYESCYRAAKHFGVTSTIAVSQQFHLPRIIYFCKAFGIETIGFAADRREYKGWWGPIVRERLARIKGWWEIEVTKPEPRVSTKYIIQ